MQYFTVNLLPIFNLKTDFQHLKATCSRTQPLLTHSTGTDSVESSSSKFSDDDESCQELNAENINQVVDGEISENSKIAETVVNSSNETNDKYVSENVDYEICDRVPFFSLFLIFSKNVHFSEISILSYFLY